MRRHGHLTHLVWVLVALLSLAVGARAESLVHGGIERTYLLHVPADLQGPRPVFMVLHPGGSYAAQFRRMAKFDREADVAGAIAVYPQGVSGHWNDGRRSEAGGPVRDADDKGFLLALIDRLAADGLADASQVHVVGHSNGGMMALRLACEAPARLRSVAAVSASLPTGLACPSDGPPVAALLIRGMADLYLPLAGGAVKGEDRRGTVLPAEATLGIFARRNGCASPTSQRAVSNGPADATPATVTTYGRCTGAPTVSIALEGSGHGWPGFPYSPRMTAMIGPAAPDFSATRVIARFFVAREVP